MSHSLTRYKEQVVDSHFQDIQFHNELYGQQSEALEQIRQDYQTALAEYQSCRSALDTSYSHYKESELELQLAREVLDYAGCPYESTTMSVEKILEQRQKAYQDSLKALEILIEIKKSEKTELNADTVWQNEADEYKKGIQALNHIGFAEENWRKS